MICLFAGYERQVAWLVPAAKLLRQRRQINTDARHGLPHGFSCVIQEEAKCYPMVVRYRKIHITIVMNPADSPFPAMIDAEKPGGTAKAAEAVVHVKIVVHQIYTVKKPDRWSSVHHR